jgi:hypothetical protein
MDLYGDLPPVGTGSTAVEGKVQQVPGLGLVAPGDDD